MLTKDAITHKAIGVAEYKELWQTQQVRQVSEARSLEHDSVYEDKTACHGMPLANKNGGESWSDLCTESCPALDCSRG